MAQRVEAGRRVQLGPLDGVVHRPPLVTACPWLAAVVVQHEFIAAATNGDAVKECSAFLGKVNAPWPAGLGLADAHGAAGCIKVIHLEPREFAVTRTGL